MYICMYVYYVYLFALPCDANGWKWLLQVLTAMLQESLSSLVLLRPFRKWLLQVLTAMLQESLSSLVLLRPFHKGCACDKQSSNLFFQVGDDDATTPWLLGVALVHCCSARVWRGELALQRKWGFPPSTPWAHIATQIMRSTSSL